MTAPERPAEARWDALPPGPASGLQELQAMMARGVRPPMMELMDIDLVEAEEGRVVFAATPGRSVYNPLGIAHGGFAATLLDSACGIAAHSAMKVPRNCVTLELKVAYHRAMTEATGRVRAIGTVLSMGNSVAYTEARLVDGEGRLHASATSTLLMTDR